MSLSNGNPLGIRKRPTTTFLRFKNLVDRDPGLGLPEICKRLNIGTLQATAWAARLAVERKDALPPE